jgi:VWFA-related protein
MSLLLSLIVFAPPARGGDGPSDAEIARAIARGVKFLKDQQEPQGNWTYSYNHNHTLGITALAGLALLENGVERNDPSIVGATRAVVSMAQSSNQTYDLALAILYLARVQPGSRGEHDDLIKRLARRLASGESGGMWTYTVPLAGDDETGNRRAPKSGTRKRRVRVEPGDNSNTQFALLGIWGGGRHGFDSDSALEAIDGHFRESQNSNGGWGYVSGGPSSEAMTCAGLMGLAIAAARPSQAERLSAKARGAALAADPVFAAALRAVTEDAKRLGPRSEIYYLWSLERVCVALGLRKLGGFDWYAAGARELVDRQRAQGDWPAEPWGTLPHTCLALLFLRKANLAFELDRVLKLPDPSRPPAVTVAAPEPAAEPKEKAGGGADSGGGDASVTVTGASDEKFPEITVEFEIKRPDGSFLLDANRDDIRVTEDGQPVSVLSLQAPVAKEARPITVVLVVDRSGSMEDEDRIGGLKRAVASFTEGLPKGSRVAVVAFGSEVETICPFTSDPQEVQNAVKTLTPSGATRYYDAVAEALEMLQKEQGRRAILALTDGEDTFSQSATLESVIVAARRLGLPIHTLGLGTEEEIASDELRHLAVSTRGQYYPARQADQLRTIYEQLAERLRSSYSLVYRTDRHLPDGTLRPVRVSYRASKKTGETAVFIPGMVVPAAGWSRLFLVLVGALSALALGPYLMARRPLK